MAHNERRNEKMKSAVQQLAADFIERESSGLSLITVTDVHLNDLANQAMILVTVLPADKEADALDFLKRQRNDFQQYVRSHSRIGRIPFFDFAIDLGEKNRQNIESIPL